MLVVCKRCGTVYDHAGRSADCPHFGLYPEIVTSASTTPSSEDDGPAVLHFGRELRALIVKHRELPRDDRMTVAEIVGVLESTKWNVLMAEHIAYNREQERKREADGPDDRPS